MCCCYLPPANSKTLAHKDIDLHDILHEEILSYQNLGEIIIIGDMKSRTGIKQEQWADINTTSDDGNVDCTNLDVPIIVGRLKDIRHQNCSNCHKSMKFCVLLVFYC